MDAKVISNVKLKTYRLKHLSSAPQFLNQADALNGRDGIRIITADSWNIFNKNRDAANYTSTKEILFHSEKPFKITKAKLFCVNSSIPTLTIKYCDVAALQELYHVDNCYTQLNTYHHNYKIILTPVSYSGTAAGYCNYIDIAGYFLLKENEDEFEKYLQTISFKYTDPNDPTYLIKRNNKYYVLKNTI